MHGYVGRLQNRGVPMWWPEFCLSFDIPADGFLAMLKRRSAFALATQDCRVLLLLLSDLPTIRPLRVCTLTE